MSKNYGKGKVLEFDPNKKRKLKSLHYKAINKKQFKTMGNFIKDDKYKTIKYTAFFLLLCVIVSIIKYSF